MADDDQTLDDNLRIRVSKEELEIFKRKSERLGKPYQLFLREVISAFNDGRLRIVSTTDQKTQMGELYQ